MNESDVHRISLPIPVTAPELCLSYRSPPIKVRRVCHLHEPGDQLECEHVHKAHQPALRARILCLTQSLPI